MAHRPVADANFDGLQVNELGGEIKANQPALELRQGAQRFVSRFSRVFNWQLRIRAILPIEPRHYRQKIADHGKQRDGVSGGTTRRTCITFTIGPLKGASCRAKGHIERRERVILGVKAGVNGHADRFDFHFGVRA